MSRAASPLQILRNACDQQLRRPALPTSSLRASLAARPVSTKTKTTVSLAYDLHEPPKSHLGGHNRPILILHGLFGSKRNSRNVSRVLAKELHRIVYTLDLRNHGESPHAEPHDYTHMAEDVAEFIRHHKLRNPTVIGHSMGAKTAMTMALRSPELVANLVSVDNAPVRSELSPDFARYVEGMIKVEESNCTSQKEADEILQSYESSLPIRQFLLTNLYRPRGAKALRFRIPLKVLASSLGNMGHFPFDASFTATFEKPALFIRGTRSHYVTDDMVPTIRRFFPNFQLEDIDSGHWVVSEQPELFCKAVVSFLSKL